MGTSAIVMMIFGMLIIWGGFWASVTNVVVKNRK